MSKLLLLFITSFVFMQDYSLYFDGDSNQVGQMLAGLLDYPQITFAS